MSDVNSTKTVVLIVLLGAFGAAVLLEAPVLVGALVSQLGLPRHRLDIFRLYETRNNIIHFFDLYLA